MTSSRRSQLGCSVILRLRKRFSMRRSPNGEPDTAKLVLRDLVNATVGFESLAEEIHKPAKSLHRMLSASGNPTMSNISAIFAAIKRALGVEVRTTVFMA